jgi:hypothetical protein
MVYTGRTTNINLLHLQFFPEGWVVRLQSFAAKYFRPLLFWDVTQNWFFVNLED